MPLVTANQLAAERALTGETFTDTAQRLTFAAGTGSFGYKPTYPAGASFACSFQPQPAPDVLPETDVPVIDAKLYFAHDQVLDDKDRVSITHLYGEAVTAKVYAITEGPVSSGNVQRADLKLVTE